MQVHIPRGGGAHAKKVEDNIRSVQEEVQLLQQFDHPNIVCYLVGPGNGEGFCSTLPCRAPCPLGRQFPIPTDAIHC